MNQIKFIKVNQVI